jgi:hypothetical protein
MQAMIKYAGFGVAMGNAADEIKNMADFITKSNEEDGVSCVIDKFIVSKRSNEAKLKVKS